MTENTLIVDVAADGRATVTLNRPDVHNAFDDKLIALLTTELDALDRNPAVGVSVGVLHELILSGNEGTLLIRSLAIGGERCPSERGLSLF